MVNLYEVHVIFKDIAHQPHEKTLHQFLHDSFLYNLY